MNIRGDGNNTNIAITGQDVQYLVDKGAISQLTVLADNGDQLDLSAFAVVGESIATTIHSTTYTQYTISNGSGEMAQIHWHTA